MATEDNGNSSPPKPASGPTLVTFAIAGRPRASRCKNNKSRSGCVTCKKRRVRCDEGKPTCQNCAKSKRTCEGYVQKLPAAEQRFITGCRPLLIKPTYESRIFTDQLEKDQFNYWMAFTSESSLFPTDLMSHLMPQIAREEPAIRYAAFAIGAATMGCNNRLQQTPGSEQFTEEALRHYGRAMHIVRNSETSRRSLPRAILSSLLFVTFESLQGNHKMALAHINHGCNMLDQIMRQGVYGECPPKLLDEVCSSFRRLTLLSWSLNGFHPDETETYVPWCCRGRRKRYAIDELPDTFDNLSAARRWWDIVQHHVVYNTKVSTGMNFEEVQAPRIIFPISSEVSKRYLKLLERWNDRFELLLRESAEQQGTKSEKHLLQIVSLRLMYTWIQLSLKSLYYTDLDYLSTDAATASFRTIVSLSKSFLAGQKSGAAVPSKEMFTVDTSPTWPLLVAGIFCHDETTRLEVQRLYQEYPRRDGIWDPRAFEAIVKTSLQSRGEKNLEVKVQYGDTVENEENIFGRNVVVRRGHNK